MSHDLSTSYTIVDRFQSYSSESSTSKEMKPSTNDIEKESESTSVISSKSQGLPNRSTRISIVFSSSISDDSNAKHKLYNLGEDAGISNEILSQVFSQKDSKWTVDLTLKSESALTKLRTHVQDKNEDVEIQSIYSTDQTLTTNDNVDKSKPSEKSDTNEITSLKRYDSFGSLVDDDEYLETQRQHHRHDEEEKNVLDFQFNRPIDEKDKQLIKLFLLRQGNGIKEEKFDELNDLVTIEFKLKVNKKKLLEKRTLQFMNKYKLYVSEPYNEKMFEEAKNIMMLKGFKEDTVGLFDLDILRLYAESLTRQESPDEEDIINEAIQLNKSKIFDGCYVIEFKDDVSDENVKKEIEQQSELGELTSQVELIPTVRTNMLLVRALNYQDIKLNLDEIESFFSNGCDNQLPSMPKYRAIRFYKPFVLLRYDAQDVIPDDFFKIKHEINKNQYLIEYLYNIESFVKEYERLKDLIKTSKDSKVNEIESETSHNPIENIEATGKSDLKITKKKISDSPVKIDEGDYLIVNPSLTKGSSDPIEDKTVKACQKIDQKNDDPLKPPEDTDLKVRMQIKQDSNKFLDVLFAGEKLIFPQLQEKLEPLGIFSQIDQEKKQLNINSMSASLLSSNHNEWSDKVLDIIKNFLSDFELVQVKLIKQQPIKEVQAEVDTINLDASKVCIEVLSSPMNDLIDTISICGLKNSVSKVKQEVLNRFNIKTTSKVLNIESEYPTNFIGLLYIFKFMNKMRKDNINVEIKKNENQIHLSGEKVNDAESQLKNYFKKVIHKLYPIESQIGARFFEHKSGCVFEWLKNSKINCSFSVDKQDLIVSSFEKSQIEAFSKAFKTDFMNYYVNTTRFSNLQKKSILNLIESFKDNEYIIFSNFDIESTSLTVYGLKNKVETILSKIKSIQENFDK